MRHPEAPGVRGRILYPAEGAGAVDCSTTGAGDHNELLKVFPINRPAVFSLGSLPKACCSSHLVLVHPLSRIKGGASPLVELVWALQSGNKVDACRAREGNVFGHRQQSLDGMCSLV